MEENIFTKPEQEELAPVYVMDGSRMSLGTGIKVRASDGEKFWTVDLSQLDRDSLHQYTVDNGGAEAVLLAVLRYRDG